MSSLLSTYYDTCPKKATNMASLAYENNKSVTPEELIKNANNQVDRELRELQKLNDKLKVYVDRVSLLEKENRQLEALINRRRNQCISGDPSITKKTTDLWEQLNQLRIQLDDEVKLLNESERNLRNVIMEIEQINIKQTSIRKDICSEKGKLTELEFENEMKLDEIQRLQEKIAYGQANLDKFEAEKKTFEDSVNRANKMLTDSNNERIALLNTIQTIEEEIRFYNSLQDKTQSELYNLNFYPSLEEIRIQRQNQSESIAAIRRDFEELAQSQISDLEKYYDIKTDEMRKEMKNEMKKETRQHGSYIPNQQTIGGTDIKLKYQDNSVRTQLLQNRIDKLKNEYTSLQNEHKQLEHFILQQQELQKNESNARYKKHTEINNEIAEISTKITQKYNELSSIMENHVNLNFEICAYKNLLGEKANDTYKQHSSNNFNNCPNNNVTDLTVNGQQEKGIKISEAVFKDIHFESIGDRLINNTFINSICINDIEPDGKYIILINYGSASVNIKNWSISRTVNSNESIVWINDHDIELGSLNKLKIYGKGASNEADAISANLVDGWTSGYKSTTTLTDDNGQVQATYSEDMTH